MIPYNLKALLFHLITQALVVTFVCALLGTDGGFVSVAVALLLIGFINGWLARTYSARRAAAEAAMERDTEHSE